MLLISLHATVFLKHPLSLVGLFKVFLIVHKYSVKRQGKEFVEKGGFEQGSCRASETPIPPCPPPDCDCSAAGTQGNACRKDPQVGHCVCKPNFQGTHCELCAPGFYGPGCQRESSPGPGSIPSQSPGVRPLCDLLLSAACQCSSPGVVDGTCDRDSGQCMCRTGFEGAACDRCAPGYFHFPLCQCEYGTPSGQAGVGLGLGCQLRAPCILGLQCVAAAPWGPSLRVVTTLATAHAGQSSTAPTVTAAAWATTATLSATVSEWLWWGSGQGGGPLQVPRA